MKILLADETKTEVLAEGTLESLLHYWNENKHELCDWMFEGDYPTEEEKEAATKELAEWLEYEPRTLDDLKRTFRALDLSWWTLEVK